MRGGFVDLHTHTNISDGRLSPEELLDEAQWKGLSAIAVTDHDHIGALPRARVAGASQGIEVVSGVELSCEHDDNEVHIIGLLIDETQPLLDALGRMQRNRTSRMREMIEQLKLIGIELDFADIQQEEGNSHGRPHLAQLLVERGYVTSISEAFARYIGDQGPGYVPKARWTVAEGVALIHEANGLAFLAHPGASGVQDLIPQFATDGLDGVEVYYPKHSKRVEQELLSACTDLHLAVCGGSDYHANGSGVELGVPRIPEEVLARIKERKGI